MSDEPSPGTGNIHVTDEWNHTEAPFPRDLRLAEAFRRQAALTPGNLAVMSSGRQLTYEQLDAYSDRIAAAILRKSREATGAEVEAGTPVGVCLERGASPPPV